MGTRARPGRTRFLRFTFATLLGGMGLLLVPGPNAMAGWTESAHLITEMRIQPGYAWVRLDTNDTVVIDQTCDMFSNWFVMDETVNAQFDHIVASAMTAMTVRAPVKIFSSGCGANPPKTYPRIDIIWLYDD